MSKIVLILCATLWGSSITISSARIDGGQDCFELRNHTGILIVHQTDCGSQKLSDTWLASAHYSNQINQTGWAQLDLQSNPQLNDSMQAFYGGLLEGYLTSKLIAAHRFNLLSDYCTNATEYCRQMRQFMEQNLVFMKKQVLKCRHFDAFWHHVGLMLEQIQGLNEGAKLSESQTGNNMKNLDINVTSLLDTESVLWINLIWDLQDIEIILGKGNESQFNQGVRMLPRERCSALVKLIKNGEDILVSQNTWVTYNLMLRIVKKYKFSFHQTMAPKSELIPGYEIAMSSYPGTVFSLDDFYMVSSNLAVTETSIKFFDDEAYKRIKPDNIVLGFIRNMVPNRLASSGKQWTQIFSAYNSGTFNNQFMIVDYKEFDKHKNGNGTSPPENVLWVIEQAPGMTVAADLTSVLYEQTYWASYNRPYFKEIFERGQWPQKVKALGDYYSYNDTSRAKIFRRDHGKVVDIKSMYKLMRYNDFKNDPLSRCNCSPPFSASLAISARGDLNDPSGTYEIDELGFSSEGSIDVKITNSQLIKKLEMLAESGPTQEGLPAFQWSKTSLKETVKHLLQPDLWNFKPVNVSWNSKPFAPLFW